MKVWENICFYIVLCSILFTIGWCLPWIVLGASIGALLLGIKKGIEKIFKH